MKISFASIIESIETFFHIAQSEPQVVAQSANQIIEAAKPAVDAIAGAGAAESAEAHVTATANKLTTLVQPYLQDAAMAEPLVNAVVATLSSASAKAATETPVTTTPSVSSGGTTVSGATGSDTVSGATSEQPQG